MWVTVDWPHHFIVRECEGSGPEPVIHVTFPIIQVVLAKIPITVASPSLHLHPPTICTAKKLQLFHKTCLHTHVMQCLPVCVAGSLAGKPGHAQGDS